MKKTILILFILLPVFLFPSEDYYKNYIQAYGEGPIGQYMNGMRTVTYSKEQGVEIAVKELQEFLSGMIYGYYFEYKVENRLDDSKGFFDVKNLAVIKLKDNPFFKYSQLQESAGSIRLQGTYRLSDDQKTYINGFNSSLAVMSMGEASGPWIGDWENRMDIFRNALRNAVLNEAKKTLKSRPLYLKGKLRLRESPVFFVKNGNWYARVIVDVMISDVSYRENY